MALNKTVHWSDQRRKLKNNNLYEHLWNLFQCAAFTWMYVTGHNNTTTHKRGALTEATRFFVFVCLFFKKTGNAKLQPVFFNTLFHWATVFFKCSVWLLCYSTLLAPSGLRSASWWLLKNLLILMSGLGFLMQQKSCFIVYPCKCNALPVNWHYAQFDSVQ